MEQIQKADSFEKTVSGELGLCGGRGACGKCRVRFLSAASLPSFADRAFFSPEELREGWRLACTAKPIDHCEVEIRFVKDEKTAPIVTWTEEVQDGREDFNKKRTVGEGNILIGVIDLGTTTVVMQLVDCVTGDILYTHAFLNPQRRWGTDVMARIEHAVNESGLQLQTALLTELEHGFEQMQKYGKPEKVMIAGNTTMGHLLMGYPVKSLGEAPFHPFSVEMTNFDLFGHPAVLMPGISAFVGADVVAGIYACGMAWREEYTLFIDLGTNGEIAIGNRERILCTATAAGSSFEGDISVQAMGTDIVAIAFDMLKAGIMDATGLMAEPWFTNGWNTKTIVIYQQDIRKLQMAKAAICAGVSILLDKTEAWDKVSHVYLAGGFGYYLDVEKAVGIGLIPAALRGRCKAVGNTSLAGAIKYGREYVKDMSRSEKLRHIVRISQAINLAEQPEFEDRYIKSMSFEEVMR